MTAEQVQELTPSLRGVSHAAAFWLALLGAIVLVSGAEPGTARVAALVYGVGACAVFGGSALYHRWPGDPRWRPLMRRVDLSAIYLCIATTTTPPALLVLDGTIQVVVLAGVWAGALAGITITLAGVVLPPSVATSAYVALGWFTFLGVPQLVDRLPAAPLQLLLTGAVLYTVGAIVYVRRRPDPWPQTFGFHEIFHALVIAGAICHFAAMAGWIVPS